MMKEKIFCKIIHQNEYFIFNKQANHNIIGFITFGIYTCSNIVLYTKNEIDILITHIDENSNFYNMFEKFLQKLENENINEINIIYSNGLKSCKNPKRNYSSYIKEIKENLEIKYPYFKNKIMIIKEIQHEYPINLIKFISYESYNKVKMKIYDNLKKKINCCKNIDVKYLYENKLKNFENNFLDNELIIYGFENSEIESIFKDLNIELKK